MNGSGVTVSVSRWNATLSRVTHFEVIKKSHFEVGKVTKLSRPQVMRLLNEAIVRCKWNSYWLLYFAFLCWWTHRLFLLFCSLIFLKNRFYISHLRNVEIIIESTSEIKGERNRTKALEFDWVVIKRQSVCVSRIVVEWLMANFKTI